MRRGLIPLREFESHRLRQNAKRPQVGAVLKVDNRDIGGTLARGFDDLADAAMDRARDLLVSTFPDGVATRNKLETLRSRDMMRSKTTFMTPVPTGAGLHSSSDHLRLASLRSVPGGISTRLPF